MTNPVLDRERVAFLKARSVVRKVLLPAWPRASRELSLVEVEVDWVRFSTLNHRTRAEQFRAIHLAKRPDLFQSDPLGIEAQNAQFEILRSQEGFALLKQDLKERGQQEPAVITAEGVLINGNRRSVALRSLYLTDRHLAARYVQCLVLPEDATSNELVDLETELQVAQRFEEDYSWVNEAILIQELYERERKDFAAVAKRMHIDVAVVREQFEKLQQLHQLVALSKGARLHIDFKENESAFAELNKHIRNKSMPEQDSVRSTYFLGTLAGVNYRTLRHLRRPDAAEMVRQAIDSDQALKPLLETISAGGSAGNANDPLDDLLGEAPPLNGLADILGCLAGKSKEDSIKIAGGGLVSVEQIYSTIHSAITTAANDAEEDARDNNAVTEPVVRATKAVSELQRAVAALPKARKFEGWNEASLQVKVSELTALVEKLTLSK